MALSAKGGSRPGLDNTMFLSKLFKKQEQAMPAPVAEQPAPAAEMPTPERPAEEKKEEKDAFENRSAEEMEKELQESIDKAA